MEGANHTEQGCVKLERAKTVIAFSIIKSYIDPFRDRRAEELALFDLRYFFFQE